MIQENVKPHSGCLLLSEPFMLDPHFKRTVILICEHDESNGSVGFILNRKIERINVSDALVNFEMVHEPLYYGGPVAQDTLHYLHCYGSQIEDSMRIMDGVYWGGNFEQITSELKSGKLEPGGFRFFMGYSGWDPGQLMEELESDSWIIANGKAAHIFEMSPNALWANVLDSMGGKFKEIKNYPEHPSLN